MTQFFIGGIIDCLKFTRADYIAQNLVEILPNFRIKVYAKKENTFQNWLEKINKKYGWKHKGSPVVWRELGETGGKVQYIGGIEQFMEFAKEYYDFDSFTIKGDKLQDIADDKLHYYHTYKEERRKEKTRLSIRKICVSGSTNTTTDLLVSQLLSCREIYLPDGIQVNVFTGKTVCYEETGRENSNNVKVFTSLSRALKNCQIVVITDFVERKDDEDMLSWLRRTKEHMTALSKTLNETVDCSIVRVIVTSAQLTCFNASVLLNATTLKPENIVAVTSHFGTQVLQDVVKACGIDAEDIVAEPPVWGFVGLKHYVDVWHAKFRYKKYLPDQHWRSRIRSLKSFMDTNKPAKKPKPSGKFTLIDKWKNVEFEIGNLGLVIPYSYGRTVAKSTSGSVVEQPRVHFNMENYLDDIAEGTIRLLKFWLTEGTDSECLSAGIATDGTFGLKAGLIMSQPIKKVRNRLYPCEDYPMPNEFEDMPQIKFVYKLAKLLDICTRFDQEPAKQLPKHPDDVLQFSNLPNSVKMSHGTCFEICDLLLKNKLKPNYLQWLEYVRESVEEEGEGGKEEEFIGEDEVEEEREIKEVDEEREIRK